MTAMCDVAFLLLSFFILTTKFKPDEVLAVTTLKSVSTTPAEQKDIVMVTMDREGKSLFFCFGWMLRKKSLRSLRMLTRRKILD